MTGWATAEEDFDAPPAWELKPHEKVCMSCWMVQPCDCEETP